VQSHGACDCAVTPARRFWRTRRAKPPRRATYATARTPPPPSPLPLARNYIYNIYIQYTPNRPLREVCVLYAL